MFTLTHTRLLVVNFKECFRFYRDIMGFEILWGDENGTYADFEAGASKLALFQREAMAEAIGTDNLPLERAAQDDVCLIFAVDDVDRMSQELGQKGVQFVTEPKDYEGWGIRAAHFRDPDGNLLEINKELDAS